MFALTLAFSLKSVIESTYHFYYPKLLRLWSALSTTTSKWERRYSIAMATKFFAKKTIGQKLRILNPVSPFVSFPQFVNLPAEIRCMIWNFAMAYNRLINVELHQQTGRKKALKYLNGISEDLKRLFNDNTNDYGIPYFHGSAMSALFQITSESRREAEKFYRVKILGTAYGNYERSVNGILYLCPELDMVHISAASSPFGGVMEFAQNVLINDPKGIGLINIGIPADVSADDAKSVANETSFQLEHLSEVIGRFEKVVFVQVTAPHQLYKQLCNASTPIAKLHRPTPVAGQATCYDILDTDPRPIQDELKRLYLGSVDPRRGLGAWNLFLEILQAKILDENIHDRNNHNWNFHNHNITYHLMLYYSEHHASYTLDEAPEQIRGGQACVGEESVTYGCDVQKRSSGCDLMTKEVLGTIQERNKMPQLAIGFWLFPIESIGSLASNMPWSIVVKLQYDRVENMTKYPPQLCLFHLP
ncbi:hypothetical protein FGRMN_3034 [Fusarium graminum]|nr:hypothetical protein FGRMN_3034 [Fusarium graminum]